MTALQVADKIGVYAHRLAQIGGFDAGKDGAHGGQRLAAGNLGLAVVDERIHEFVDHARAGGDSVEVIAGGGMAEITDLQGNTGCVVDQHDALGAI